MHPRLQPYISQAAILCIPGGEKVEYQLKMWSLSQCARLESLPMRVLTNWSVRVRTCRLTNLLLRRTYRYADLFVRAGRPDLFNFELAN